MKTSIFLERLIKDKTKRNLSKMNLDGLQRIIGNTDKSVWNSMEDLFGNLFTGIQTLIHHLDNSNLEDDKMDAFREQLAIDIGKLLTIKEFFTDAKTKSK